MQKIILRIAAILLTFGLLADPVTAAVFLPSFYERVSPSALPAFQEQALASQALDVLRSLLPRTPQFTVIRQADLLALSGRSSRNPIRVQWPDSVQFSQRVKRKGNTFGEYKEAHNIRYRHNTSRLDAESKEKSRRREMVRFRKNFIGTSFLRSWNPLVIPPTVIGLTGDFVAAQTLQKIFDTLGRFPQNFAIRWMDVVPYAPYIEPRERLGSIPFDLSSDGQAYFVELAGVVSAKVHAQVLVLTSAGSKIIPYGILVQLKRKNEISTGDQAFFLDLTPLLNHGGDLLHIRCAAFKALRMSEMLYPPTKYPLVPFTLDVEGYTAPDSHSGSLALLSLRRNTGETVLYSPQASQSRDFQEALLHEHAALAGRDVVELGAGGYAINGLWSARAGARSYRGVEPYISAYLMAVWNIQYVQDTRQVPAIPMQVSRGGFPSGDIYLLNAGGVSEMYAAPTDPYMAAIRMPVAVYRQLMDQIRSKLLQKPSWALVRVLVSNLEDTHLAQLTPSELDIRQVSDREGWGRLVQLVRERFLDTLKVYWIPVEGSDHLAYLTAEPANRSQSPGPFNARSLAPIGLASIALALFTKPELIVGLSVSEGVRSLMFGGWVDVVLIFAGLAGLIHLFRTQIRIADVVPDSAAPSAGLEQQDPGLTLWGFIGAGISMGLFAGVMMFLVLGHPRSLLQTGLWVMSASASVGFAAFTTFLVMAWMEAYKSRVSGEVKQISHDHLTIVMVWSLFLWLGGLGYVVGLALAEILHAIIALDPLGNPFRASVQYGAAVPFAFHFPGWMRRSLSRRTKALSIAT